MLLKIRRAAGRNWRWDRDPKGKAIMSRFNGAKIRALLGGRGFYIALVLGLTAVGVLGYYTLFHEEPPAEEVVNPTPVVDQTPVDPVPPPPVEDKTPDEPVTAVEEIPEVEDLLPQVISPLDGTTVTVFSMNELLYDETMADWRTHDGLDIQAAEGDAVKTAAAGTVVAVVDDELMGTTVWIEHAGGYTTQYSSLAEELKVSAGDSVKLGQAIGCVGSTALVETAIGPHVHFSVTYRDEQMDPAEFLSLGQ